MNTENLSTLKIHKLTQAQYDRELAAGRIDASALYLTPEAEIDYSLGTTTKQLSNVDLNTVKENGWYSYTTSAGITNVPKDYTSTLFVESYHTGDRIKQTVTLMDGNNTTIVRAYYDGSWGSWEYVNPPMELNTEYRTTERWDDKPVYQYLLKVTDIPTGSSSSSGLKQVPMTSGMWNIIVDLQVTWVRPSLTTSGNALFVNGAVGGFAYVASNNVAIKTYDNITDATVYVRLKYVKN